MHLDGKTRTLTAVSLLMLLLVSYCPHVWAMNFSGDTSTPACAGHQSDTSETPDTVPTCCAGTHQEQPLVPQAQAASVPLVFDSLVFDFEPAIGQHLQPVPTFASYRPPGAVTLRI